MMIGNRYRQWLRDVTGHDSNVTTNPNMLNTRIPENYNQMPMLRPQPAPISNSQYQGFNSLGAPGGIPQWLLQGAYSGSYLNQPNYSPQPKAPLTQPVQQAPIPAAQPTPAQSIQQTQPVDRNIQDGGGGAKDGGYISGKGGPRDDKIDMKLSNGEFVIPAHIVKTLGRAYFEQMLKNHPLKK
jgi:hypothetical protein